MNNNRIRALKKSGMETHQIGNQTLILGDSLEVLRILKYEFDACVTDPPYNISGYDNKGKIGWYQSNDYWKIHKKFTKIDENWDKFTNEDYLKFTEKWLALVSKRVKPNGNILVFGTYHNIYGIGQVLDKLDKRIVNSIVWYKRNAFPNITHRMLCESTEYIIWAVNNTQKNAKGWTFNYELLKQFNNGKQLRNMWDIPLTPKAEKILGKHPSQKPIKIIERLIRGFTNEDEIVLDPFMGSGTTCLVCHNLNRKSIGIESNRQYFDLALARLKDVSNNNHNEH